MANPTEAPTQCKPDATDKLKLKDLNLFANLQKAWNDHPSLPKCPPRENWEIKYTTYPGNKSSPAWLISYLNPNDPIDANSYMYKKRRIFHERSIPNVIRQACAALDIEPPQVGRR